MTIEYAKAHGKERIAHAHAKRLQREATLMHRAIRDSRMRSIRAAVGIRLIKTGERLSTTRSPVASTVKGRL